MNIPSIFWIVPAASVVARVTAEKFTGVCRRARMEPF